MGGLRALRVDEASITIINKGVMADVNEVLPLSSQCLNVAQSYHAQLMDPLGASIVKIDNAKLHLEENKTSFEAATWALGSSEEELDHWRENIRLGRMDEETVLKRITILEAKSESLIAKVHRLESKVESGEKEVQEVEASYKAELKQSCKGENV